MYYLPLRCHIKFSTRYVNGICAIGKRILKAKLIITYILGTLTIVQIDKRVIPEIAKSFRKTSH